MKKTKVDDVFALIVDRGKLTFQVPYSCEGNHPKDYFMTLASEALAVGKESGFLYLSPKGYEALKETLRNDFPPPLTHLGYEVKFTFDDVEKYAAKFFKEVREKTEKKRNGLLAKLSQIDNFLMKIP